jgi:hypothetical protein
MKCLSLMQPYATLVVSGAKRYETRDWKSDHQGLLAIHASAKFPDEARALCRQEPFRSALLRAGYRYPADLPMGAIIGVVLLRGFRRITDMLSQLREQPDELAFCKLDKVRWAWEMAEPRALLLPHECRGRLGVFEAPVQLSLFDGSDPCN